MSQIDLAYRVAVPFKLPRGTAARRIARSAGRIGAGWTVPLALLAFWSMAAEREWVPAQILPAPSAVWEVLRDQIRSGEIFGHAAISLLRVAGGFGAGSVLGLVLGIAMGLSRKVESYVYPMFKALAQVPVLGWLPLAMMFFGIGEGLKVFLIATATMVPVVLNTVKGIRGVPRAYVELGRAYRFTHAQMLHKVVFPAAVPSIFAGIRYGLSQAWLSLVTVELLASSEGLGFLIVWGRQLFQLDVVLSAIVVVGIVGLLLDRGIGSVQARLLRWRREVV
jgi:sulfonate transport system permease protein